MNQHNYRSDYHRRSAFEAVSRGLLRFAPPGETFPGRKGSKPVEFLVDSRAAGSNLALRGLIVEGLGNALKKFEPLEVIAGVSRSGVVWGCLVAWLKSLPFVVVLPEGPRASGLQRAVEGDVTDRSIVLIDNFVRSGSSLAAAAHYARLAGAHVAGAAVLVGKPLTTCLVPLVPVWTLTEVISASLELGLINAERHERILNENEQT